MCSISILDDVSLLYDHHLAPFKSFVLTGEERWQIKGFKVGSGSAVVVKSQQSLILRQAIPDFTKRPKGSTSRYQSPVQDQVVSKNNIILIDHKLSKSHQSIS